MTSPAGFDRPPMFIRPAPAVIRKAAWDALRAQAARLEAKRQAEKEAKE
jgi:hypothetical protein